MRNYLLAIALLISAASVGNAQQIFRPPVPRGRIYIQTIPYNYYPSVTVQRPAPRIDYYERARADYFRRNYGYNSVPANNGATYNKNYVEPEYVEPLYIDNPFVK
jgi:hypothetical protein